MRFAFCIFKYFPYGGIQRDLMKVVSECRARGHAVKIFTLRWQAPLLETEGVEVEVAPIEGLSRHTQYEHFAEYVNKAVHQEEFDLVIGFNKMPGLDVYYAGDSCFIEKAMLQRPVWYRALPRFRSFYNAERAVFSHRSHTQILTLSDVEVPLYRTHYKTQPERFHALPPGIERDRIAPQDPAVRRQLRQDLRREFGLADDATVLLFIGSGFIKKGLDRALLAVAALPAERLARTHLFVIGRDKADAFERMVMRLGITAQVTFFCEGRDDVPRFLFAADGLIHPAYDEAAGMVIVEAILAGVPALVSRNCGYARYVSQYDAGIVLPRGFSQQDLDRALLELLTSPQRPGWIANGLSAKNDAHLFQLVPKLVDWLEDHARDKPLVLAFALFRYFPYGGLQRDFMRIALACQQHGYSILVYCLSWQGERPPGFEIIEVEVPGVANHTQAKQFAEFVNEHVRWRLPAGVIGFNKMPGLDVYYAADSCFEHKAQQMRTGVYRRTRRYQLYSEFEDAVFNAAASTHVLLIAEAQKQQFARYYDTQPERLHMLPPGVSADRRRSGQWQQQRLRVREEFAVADNEFLLLLVGSGFITKGLDRALHALASLPQTLRQRCRMLVIGEDHASQFLRLAGQLGVSDQLTISKGRDDIPAVMQGADVMVHPAYMESGGMVLIEAVVAGLPVIATAVCGFAHYIDDAAAGVVLAEPFSQQELNEQLCRALTESDLRRRWSANGVEFGRTNNQLYDMPAHALKVIKQLLEQR